MKIKHIAQSVDAAIEFIRKRKVGEERSLSTGFAKLDDALMGGLP